MHTVGKLLLVLIATLMLVGCSRASDQPAGDLRQQLIDTYVGGLTSAQQLEMLTTQGRIIEDEVQQCMDPGVEASLDGVRVYEVSAAIATFDCSQPYDRVLRETLLEILESA